MLEYSKVDQMQERIKGKRKEEKEVFYSSMYLDFIYKVPIVE